MTIFSNIRSEVVIKIVVELSIDEMDQVMSSYRIICIISRILLYSEITKSINFRI